MIGANFRSMFAASKTAPAPLRDPSLVNLFGLRPTASGQNVTPDTAMRVTAVMAAVRAISESIASLPLFLYQRGRKGGKFRAFNEPLYKILHDQPNQWQTSYEFREMMMGHVLLRGNAYAQIIPGRSTPVAELVPLHPDKVLPFKSPDGSVAYVYQKPSGKQRILLGREVHHLRGFSSNGLVGLNPIEFARETIGVALGAEEYGARFFANDATPRIVIEHPGHFKDKESRIAFRNAWQAAQAGDNRHKTAVLEDGLSIKELGLSNKDSQFLETRQFSLNDIARIFRIQPHRIGDLSRSTNNNIEQQSLEYVIYTLRPWLVNWEQSLTRDLLLTPRTKQSFFIQFLVDALLRGDTSSRFEAYAKARQWGWMSVNDIRRLENQNTIGASGDTYLTPLNMQQVGQRQIALERVAAERVVRREEANSQIDIEKHAAWIKQILLVDDDKSMAIAKGHGQPDRVENILNILQGDIL